MDTDPTGQRRYMITVAMLTESTGIFHRDGDKVFHGNLASERNISVGEVYFTLKPIGFCKSKKIMYPMMCDSSIDLFFSIMFS
jgi:hypothetical protein